jgi:hypothetical protein
MEESEAPRESRKPRRVAALDEDWKMIEQLTTTLGRDGAPPPRTPKRDMATCW